MAPKPVPPETPPHDPYVPTYLFPTISDPDPPALTLPQAEPFRIYERRRKRVPVHTGASTVPNEATSASPMAQTTPHAVQTTPTKSQPTSTAAPSIVRSRPANLHPNPKQVQHFTPSAFHASTTFEHFTPSAFHASTTFEQWQQAMADEYAALIRNGTWTLVPHRETAKTARQQLKKDVYSTLFHLNVPSVCAINQGYFGLFGTYWRTANVLHQPVAICLEHCHAAGLTPNETWFNMRVEKASPFRTRRRIEFERTCSSDSNRDINQKIAGKGERRNRLALGDIRKNHKKKLNEIYVDPKNISIHFDR
ncbi:unnamed protein product [Lactuca virosa]|uniref:Uncharacterized protein n=1 Tax=Lactuca virosa TaxID=75947 RepID=A0AAU9LVQ0_9ASTR|nr:unnamed protein product [Lactuca virosa]